MGLLMLAGLHDSVSCAWFHCSPLLNPVGGSFFTAMIVDVDVVGRKE